MHLKFNRIQFTPDLMPTDITGTEVIQEDKLTGERVFRFVPGPIFANIVLADEINRTPPKTQAALLEAMQERDVTAAGTTYPLDPPFFVLATQNPIEQEGTYPLPEAQLDRFMFDLRIHYPDRAEEEKIATLTQEVQGHPDRAGRARLGDHRAAAAGAAHSGTAVDRGVRGPPGAFDAARGRRAGRRGEAVHQLGRRAAGVAIPGAGGQGARRLPGRSSPDHAGHS